MHNKEIHNAAICFNQVIIAPPWQYRKPQTLRFTLLINIKSYLKIKQTYDRCIFPCEFLQGAAEEAVARLYRDEVATQ